MWRFVVSDGLNLVSYVFFGFFLFFFFMWFSYGFSMVPYGFMLLKKVPLGRLED